MKNLLNEHFGLAEELEKRNENLELECNKLVWETLSIVFQRVKLSEKQKKLVIEKSLTQACLNLLADIEGSVDSLYTLNDYRNQALTEMVKKELGL